MARIAVIAEDTRSAPKLIEHLQEGGHECRLWRLGAEYDEDILSFDPCLVVVDCQTAHGLNSWYEALCYRLSIPIFTLVPEADDALVVRALGAGADGCLSKPYSQEALLAHLDACLRRYFEWNHSSLQAPKAETYSEPVIDSASCVVKMEGRTVQLSSTECRLLERLLKDRGRIVSREDLTSYVWGRQPSENANSNLSLCVYNLRHTIEPRPDQPKHILTKWGAGYFWADS